MTPGESPSSVGGIHITTQVSDIATRGITETATLQNFGICIQGSGEHASSLQYNNVEMMKNGEEWTSATPMLWQSEIPSADIIAYAPYQADISEALATQKQFPVSVKAVQTKEDLSSDLLVFKAKDYAPTIVGENKVAHCEDINLVNGGVMNEDAHSKELGLRGITNSVEDIIVARDIMLSGDTGAKLHLCHCSTRDSVKMVRYAKMEQMKVTAEVCPHHFTLTSDDIHKIEPSIDQEKKLAIDADADTNFKMNPPLRSREDVQALKEGLRDNIMDVISTDHAPHTFEEKNTSMKKAPFGIVGLETAACLTYTELVLQGYLTPMQMAEKMSYNPAKIVGIDKGDIQPGKIADIVIFDPEKTYKIDKTKFASKGRNTPFDGREVTGKVMATIVDGRVVYEAEA